MRRLLFIVTVVILAGCDQRPSLIIDGEQLAGKYVGEEGVATFLGVPFAEPPVGDLRWRAPQPLQTKQQRRDTTEFAAACIQSMRILDWYRYMAEIFGESGDYYEDLATSEDCLYLNLWTPTLEADAKLPVMVWIHGGSNRSGWSYEANYRGHVLAPQGVVVVTVAYRQGAFGFLSHPELDGDEPIANFGIWDIIAALHWIQDNIGQFGGDPDRVTLFGESSGGENILALVFSDPAKGLFNRGVLQSAARYGISMPTLADEQRRGSDLAKAFGFDGDETLVRLRQVPANKLLQVYEDTFAEHYHSAAIDGQLFSTSTWENIQAGNFAEHDLMLGTNNQEWLDYISASVTADDVVHTAAELRRMDGAAALAVVAAEPDPRRTMDRLITADAYVCPSQNTAAHRAASGGKAWMYFFSRIREDKGGVAVGAYHGAEYPYVFGTHDAYMNTNQVDLELSATMQRYWINFAATGDPNAEGLPIWPRYQPTQPLVQELGDNVRSIPAIEPELCALFEAWNENRD